MLLTCRSALHSVLVIASLVFAGNTYADILPLYGDEELPELDRGAGYALIGVDNGGTDSFLIVTRLNKDGREPRRIRGDLAKTQKKFRINLGGRPAGFYLTVLPKGLYQITEISYPYFNLPFRMDTEGQRAWRFLVQEGRTSYVGQLVIATERSEDTLDVNLLNRLAVELDNIRSDYATLLLQFPLASGIGVRDDFFEFITSP